MYLQQNNYDLDFASQNFIIGFLLGNKTSAIFTSISNEMKNECINNNINFMKLAAVILTYNGYEITIIKFIKIKKIPYLRMIS